jgi:hypothetical protein
MTVDRLVSHYSVQQLEDGVNEVVESLTATAEEDSSPVVMENLLLPPFPELFQERQRVMTHCALQASSRAPVMVVVGAHHVGGIKDQWHTVCDERELEGLLSAQLARPDCLEADLQKRALLLALFAATRAIPGEAVTTSLKQDLTESETQLLMRTYSMYREQFHRKLLEAAVLLRSRIMKDGVGAKGLPQLVTLLGALEVA